MSNYFDGQDDFFKGRTGPASSGFIRNQGFLDAQRRDDDLRGGRQNQLDLSGASPDWLTWAIYMERPASGIIDVYKATGLIIPSKDFVVLSMFPRGPIYRDDYEDLYLYNASYGGWCDPNLGGDEVEETDT